MKVKILQAVSSEFDLKRINLDSIFYFAKNKVSRKVRFIYGLRPEAGGNNNIGDIIDLNDQVEGDILLPTSRKFCQKQVANRIAGKSYTEAQIRAFAKTDMQAKYGFNAFDNGGGFWNKSSKSGKSYQTFDHCRHTWFAVQVL
jgi:hypothetical protein